MMFSSNDVIEVSKQKRKGKKDKKDKKDKKKKEKRKHQNVDNEESDEYSNKREKLTKQATSVGISDGISENSSFQEKRARLLVSVPPSALVNIKDAMNTSMQNLLLKYSNGLGGVLIAFHDIELDGSKKDGGAYGKIINEMPHIHYYIKCNVLLFNPEIGKELKGKVNESFPSHVGLLVHELFNASISAEYLRHNGFVFNDEKYEWRMKEGDEEGRVIRVGDGMKFRTYKCHECNGLISLEGSDPMFVH